MRIKTEQFFTYKLGWRNPTHTGDLLTQWSSV